jgi:hypothetical protein
MYRKSLDKRNALHLIYNNKEVFSGNCPELRYLITGLTKFIFIVIKDVGNILC